MSKKRFATGGAGYHTPHVTKRSKIRYGLLIDPAMADNKSTTVNLKMIKDQVYCSRQRRDTTEDFLKAIEELAANPYIVWDRETSKAEFIQMASDVWFRRRVA